jgi:hypothetical protein
MDDRWKIAIFFGLMCAGFIFGLALFAPIVLITVDMPGWLYDLGNWPGTWICALVLGFAAFAGAWFLKDEHAGWSMAIFLGVTLDVIMIIPWILSRAASSIGGLR